jgi:HK97 gp10 family phage protein
MIEGKVTGLPDLKEALAGIVPKLRRRALRLALAAGARVVQKAARAKTPALNASSLMVRKGWRASGTVKKAISVRTSKLSSRRGDVGVFVNVRPLPGAKYKTVKGLFGGQRRVLVKASQRGAKNPNDPFYWRWLNWGTKRGVRAVKFIEAGATKLPVALQVFIAKIGPAIEKLNKPKAPAP